MTDQTERPDAGEGGETPPEVDFNAEMENLVEGAAGLFDSLRDIFVKSKQEVVISLQFASQRTSPASKPASAHVEVVAAPSHCSPSPA